VKIEAIEAHALLVPLTTPTAFSTRQIKGREYVLVRIRAEGAEGIGYTYAGDSGGAVSATCGRWSPKRLCRRARG